MRFTAQLRLYLPGTEALRPPTFWERIVQTFGGDVDLRTEELQSFRNALSVCEALGACLSSAGVRNAVSLALDERVIFHDAKRYPNDLEGLVHAARLHAPAAADGFKLLRAVFEHEEGDVHLLVEATFRSRYPGDEPAAVLAFGGASRSSAPSGARSRTSCGRGSRGCSPTPRGCRRSARPSTGSCRGCETGSPTGSPRRAPTRGPRSRRW